MTFQLQTDRTVRAASGEIIRSPKGPSLSKDVIEMLPNKCGIYCKAFLLSVVKITWFQISASPITYDHHCRMQFSTLLLAWAAMASTAVVAEVNFGCIKTQPEYTALSKQPPLCVDLYQ